MLFLPADFLLAAALTWVVNTIALVSFRRTRGQHWTERARRLYPARVGARMNLWIVPLVVVLAQQAFWPEIGPHWLLAALFAGIGAVAATFFFDREIMPSLTSRQWLHEALVGSGLRLLVFLLFLGTAACMPLEFNRHSFEMAGALAVVIGLWATKGFALTFSLSRLTCPPAESLQGIVNRVAERVGIRVKRVLVVRAHMMQAYALPYTNELLFTQRLLKACTEEEIEAVAAHEIGHLSESVLVRSLRLLRVVALVLWVFAKPAYHALGMLGFVLLFLGYYVILVVLNGLSRAWERRAYAMAATQKGGGAPLASALQKVYEGNLTPAVMPSRRLRTHPDLYDRLTAAGVQPDFPRPAAPRRIALSSLFLSMTIGFLSVPVLSPLKPNLRNTPQYSSTTPNPEYDDVIARLKAATNGLQRTNESEEQLPAAPSP